MVTIPSLAVFTSPPVIGPAHRISAYCIRGAKRVPTSFVQGTQVTAALMKYCDDALETVRIEIIT